MNNHIILNDTWFTDTISAISSSVTMLLCSCHEVQRSTASKSGEKSKSSFTEIYPNTIHVSMRIKETMNHEDKFFHYLLAHSTVLDTWPIGDRKSLRHEFRPARNTDLRGSAYWYQERTLQWSVGNNSKRTQVRAKLTISHLTFSNSMAQRRKEKVKNLDLRRTCIE